MYLASESYIPVHRLQSLRTKFINALKMGQIKEKLYKREETNKNVIKILQNPTA